MGKLLKIHKTLGNNNGSRKRMYVMGKLLKIHKTLGNNKTRAWESLLA